MRDLQFPFWAKVCTVIMPVVGFTLTSTLILPGNLPAQPSDNTASIAGKVREENGAAVRAVVTATSGAFLQRTFAGSDGSFQFTKLPSGSYSLCAQTSAMEVGLKDDSFVDSCAWPDFSAPRLPLAGGQAKTGAMVILKRGYLLKVRVNDPAKVLATLAGKPTGNPVSLLLSGPFGLLQTIPVTAQDAGGRTHSIVIPYDSPHKLFVHSAALGLKDGNGRDFDAVTPIAIQASHGIALPTIMVNVGQAVKP